MGASSLGLLSVRHLRACLTHVRWPRLGACAALKDRDERLIGWQGETYQQTDKSVLEEQVSALRPVSPV